MVQCPAPLCEGSPHFLRLSLTSTAQPHSNMYSSRSPKDNYLKVLAIPLSYSFITNAFHKRCWSSYFSSHTYFLKKRGDSHSQGSLGYKRTSGFSSRHLECLFIPPEKMGSQVCPCRGTLFRASLLLPLWEALRREEIIISNASH